MDSVVGRCQCIMVVLLPALSLHTSTFVFCARFVVNSLLLTLLAQFCFPVYGWRWRHGVYFNMHISTFCGILLGLAVAWPKPYEDGEAPSSVVDSSSIDYISGSYSKQAMSQRSSTSEGHLPTSAATPNPSDVQSTSLQFQTTDVMTRTWLTAATQTSFIPASTLITHSGSIIYYSTWLSIAYPTTIVTSTEYVTGNGGLTVQTTVTTMSILVPPTTYECMCPPPTTETVYVFATIGPVMTIPSAIVLSYESMFSDQQTVVTTIPVATTSSDVFSSMATASLSSLPDIVSTSARNESLLSSTPTSVSIQTSASGYGNPTGNSNSTGMAAPLMVSQMPNGQLIIPS